jgi:hypothetical protein
MTTGDISNPILNSPYAAPERHFELGPNGPTGEMAIQHLAEGGGSAAWSWCFHAKAQAEQGGIGLAK